MDITIRVQAEADDPTIVVDPLRPEQRPAGPCAIEERIEIDNAAGLSVEEGAVRSVVDEIRKADDFIERIDAAGFAQIATQGADVNQRVGGTQVKEGVLPEDTSADEVTDVRKPDNVATIIDAIGEVVERVGVVDAVKWRQHWDGGQRRIARVPTKSSLQAVAVEFPRADNPAAGVDALSNGERRRGIESR
jgi:hypothetical protein